MTTVYGARSISFACDIGKSYGCNVQTPFAWWVRPATRHQLVRRNTCQKHPNNCDCQEKSAHKCVGDCHPFEGRNTEARLRNLWFPSSATCTSTSGATSPPSSGTVQTKQTKQAAAAAKAWPCAGASLWCMHLLNVFLMH